MPTSAEDLSKLQKDVESLRDKVAAEETKRANREAELANDVTAANLQAEKTRLEAQLAAAKQANSASAVKEGVSAPLDAAKEDQARAQAQLNAVTDSTDK